MILQGNRLDSEEEQKISPDIQVQLSCRVALVARRARFSYVGILALISARKLETWLWFLSLARKLLHLQQDQDFLTGLSVYLPYPVQIYARQLRSLIHYSPQRIHLSCSKLDRLCCPSRHLSHLFIVLSCASPSSTAGCVPHVQVHTATSCKPGCVQGVVFLFPF